MNKNWHWIELVGFDNALPDYGVKHFLERLHDEAEGVSILFSHIDFINDFDAKRGEYTLLPCDCTYAGHPYGVERPRQEWTSVQLKGLIRELHKQNLKVIFSLFNFFEYIDDQGKLVETNFCSKHKELICFDQNKKVYEHSISIIKRFKDGSYYEDYFLAKLKEVIDYYQFDGVQIADGISSNRPAIQKGDFSDDIVEQFVLWLQAEGKTFSADGLTLKCDQSTALYRKRRKFILENLYFEFLQFNNACWKRFYNKLYDVIDPKKYIMFINSFWTRDPFEALYRYGIDYNVAYRDGVYALMVEEVSAGVATYSKEYVGGFNNSLDKTRYVHYEFFLMQMLLKAYIPEFKQIPLLPINDNQEQWNALNDVTNELKRAIYRRNNCNVYYKKEYVPCVDASLYCLSDGVRAHEWEFLAKLDSIKALQDIKRAVGYTLYYPKRHLFAEVKRYIETKEYGFHKLACALLSKGTQICSVITECDVLDYENPILVLFPEFLDGDEIELLSNSKATVVFVSREKSFGIKLLDGEVIVSTNKEGMTVPLETEDYLRQVFKITRCNQSVADEHGGIWTAPLKYNEWNKQYLKRLSLTLNTLIGCPVLENPTNRECKITTFEKKNGNYIMLISNDEYYTCCPTIRLDKKIKNVTSLTKYK